MTSSLDRVRISGAGPALGSRADVVPLPKVGAVVGRRTFVRESYRDRHGRRSLLVRCACGSIDRVLLVAWRAREKNPGTFGCTSKSCLARWRAEHRLT